MAFFAGLLNSIFEVLYDNDVLSVEAFEKWKQSDDPSENQGKGKELVLNDFFRLIRGFIFLILVRNNPMI